MIPAVLTCLYVAYLYRSLSTNRVVDPPMDNTSRIDRIRERLERLR